MKTPSLTIEPSGATDCTAISLCKIAYSQTGNSYDVNDLWNATPKMTNGATPLDTLKTAINRGLINTATGKYDKIWTNWFDATAGDGIEANMTIADSACMVNGYWYSDWNTLAPNSIMVAGDTVVSDHSFIITGFQNGNAVVDAHQGYNLFMPPEILKGELLEIGDALIPTNDIINAKRKINILQKIVELYQKILLIMNTTQPTQAVKYPRIVAWANAITHWEGHFDGNLKFTTLTQSWGATKGRPATDGGNFCLWKDEATGFQALCNFLTLACEGELIIAHHPCTLEQFTIKFAGNPPQGYINGIVQTLNVPPETDISTFLS